MTPAQHLALRIHELRHARGWTQQQLADHSGGQLVVSTLKDIERARYPGQKFATIRIIAQALGVTVEELLEPPAARKMPPVGRPLLEEA